MAQCCVITGESAPKDTVELPLPRLLMELNATFQMLIVSGQRGVVARKTSVPCA
jgi:hypothetical protein